MVGEPREAAADPVGRDELEQLLRGFDHDDGQPGMMRTSRLRRARAGSPTTIPVLCR